MAISRKWQTILKSIKYSNRFAMGSRTARRENSHKIDLLPSGLSRGCLTQFADNVASVNKSSGCS